MYYTAHNRSTMCDWNYEEMKEKETVSAKAKAKNIETFEKKEERPLATIS
jgi:hypothetical protein